MASRFDLDSFDPRARIARVRFVPSDRRGVLDADALRSLREVCGALARDASIRLVALEGGRPDLFAAGADLVEIAALTPGAALEFAEEGRSARDAWEALEPTTVAVVRGACFGGALDLVLASDLILAFPEARFADPGVKRGIVTGWGGTLRARRRLSPAGMEELFAEGEAIGAERALANGLADAVLQNEEALDAWLDAWAGTKGEELRRVKALARATEGLTAGQALIVEERLESLARAARLPSGG